MGSTNSLSRKTIVLHWLVALVVFFQLTGGLIMIGKIYTFYYIHKTVGIVALFFLIIPRVLWRLKKGWPTPLHKDQAYQQKLAKLVHWILISATVLMPLCGMLASAASGNGFGIFHFITIVPFNPPANPEALGIPLDELWLHAVPRSEFWADIGYALHTWIGYTMITAIGLHVVGALKHHLFDKDTTIKRMLKL